MLPGSTRLKIILSYMVLLTLMIFLFSLVLYDRLLSDLYSSLDNLLQSRAEGIADAIDTYWEVEKLEAQTDGANAEALSKANNLNFIKIAQRWVIEESNRPELLNIIIQIFDARGELIASSKNISRTIIFPKDVFAAALQGNQRFDIFSVAFSPGKPTTLRVYTKPISENKTITYIVQVASPLTTIQAALEDLKGILFVLLPILMLGTGIIGLFLAKMALRPVDKMIKAVQQITAKNLRQRVPIPRTRDEIQSLAITFNDMLERLEKSFAAQRHFIQDASHELKTPLTILEGEMGVALKRLRSPEEYESVLRSSLEEIDRLSRIVENLLTLARFDDKEIVPDAHEVDLCLLLQKTVEDMEILASQKNIALEISAPVPTTIQADRNY
ncbi:MAG: HAMP domain-containing protein, partial [Pseudomonadota bacterium]